MPDIKDSYELYEAPAWFNEKLKEIGGENRYGEALFRVCWGQGGEDACFYRAGGHWHPEGQPSYYGYRDLLMGAGTPSWLLLQWHDAVEYGSPETYYVATHDEESNLYDTGEYPYSGRYVTLFNMSHRMMVDGKFIIEHMPLNSFILDQVIPIIQEAKEISYEKYMAAQRGLKEKEDKADLDMIEDCMRDSKVAFKGPTSYARQGCRTHYIDKRVEQMQRNINTMLANARVLGKGMSVQPETSRLTQDFLKNRTQNDSRR